MPYKDLEKKKEYQNKYRELNREKLLQKKREYSKSEQGKRKAKEWKEKNREKYLESKRMEYRRHRERYMEYDRKRRPKKQKTTLSELYPDEVGKKYGSLTVKQLLTLKGKTHALCECNCNGKECIKLLTALKSGRVTSCGYQHIFNLNKENEIGKKYGLLTIKKLVLEEEKTYAICDCDCRKSFDKKILFSQIKNGRIKSCGCYNKRNGKDKELYIDLTGKTFGFWTVLYDTGKRQNGSPLWHCRCRCKKHTEKDISAACLRNGDSTSCGCKISNNTNYGFLAYIYSGKVIKSNTSGVNGVWWNNKVKKWIARIEIQKTKINLGGFDTLGEAYLARKKANEKYIKPLLEGKFTIEEIKQMVAQERKAQYKTKPKKYSDFTGINTMDIAIAETINEIKPTDVG